MRIGAGVWFLLQALIFFAVMASNIAWDWAPNPYVAALIGVALAIGANSDRHRDSVSCRGSSSEPPPMTQIWRVVRVSREPLGK